MRARKNSLINTRIVHSDVCILSGYPTMYSGYKHRTVKNTQSRRVQTKSQLHRPKKSNQALHRTAPRTTSFADRFQKLLLDLQHPGSRFSSYTVTELEEICEQLAIQQMSASASVVSPSESCQMICHFCQNLIFEPVTLCCGHTFCYQCIKDEQISATMNCPRCPDDIQGQIQSSVIYAREQNFSRNHYLMQIFERCETLTRKYQSIALYYNGKTEFTNGNYQQAVDIFTGILDQGMRYDVCPCDVTSLIEHLSRSWPSSCSLRSSQSIGSFKTTRTSTSRCHTHSGVEASMDKGEIMFFLSTALSPLCSLTSRVIYAEVKSCSKWIGLQVHWCRHWKL